jgi:hypothetical protein
MLSLSADVNRNAERLKAKLGAKAYQVQSIIEMSKKKVSIFDIKMMDDNDNIV